MAALYGFAGIVGGALLALVGVFRTGRAPEHMADVEGLRALVDELRKDRDDWRRRALAAETKPGNGHA